MGIGRKISIPDTNVVLDLDAPLTEFERNATVSWSDTPTYSCSNLVTCDKCGVDYCNTCGHFNCKFYEISYGSAGQPSQGQEV